MTIQVITNDPKPVEPVVESKEETKPALDAKASEQKETTDSETVETEEEKELESKDDSDDESEESDESGKEKPNKKKSGFHRKIDKLNARARAAQQEAEYWKQQALKGASEPKKDQVEAKPQSTDKEPDPNDDKYKTYSEYAKDLARWEVRQELKARDLEAEQKSLQAKQVESEKAHQARVKAFAEKTADFDEALESLEGLNSVTVANIIQKSENGPELLYELAKNPDEAKRICALSPVEAGIAMGELKAKIASRTSEPKQETKKITKAPQPIEPVRSKGMPIKKDISDPNLSQKEFEELRREQIKARASSW